MVGGTQFDVDPGGVVVFPAGTAATFGVVGESARFVAVTSGQGAGRFFADFADSVPMGRPVEDSMEAILWVTRRHDVALAANPVPPAHGSDTVTGPDLTSGADRP